MPDLATLVVFAGASLALLVVPGPSVVYIVTRSLAQGRRAGLVSMLGVQAGGCVHVLGAAVGLSALIASSATAFSLVRYAGAAYLLWLGLRLIRGAAPDADADARPAAARRLFWQGALVNVLNPKTALFFLAFLPQFVDPGAGSAALQVLTLGTVFIGLAVLSDSAYALLAGVLGARLRRSARARRQTERASGGVYVGLGALAALAGGRASA